MQSVCVCEKKPHTQWQQCALVPSTSVSNTMGHCHQIVPFPPSATRHCPATPPPPLFVLLLTETMPNWYRTLLQKAKQRSPSPSPSWELGFKFKNSKIRNSNSIDVCALCDIFIELWDCPDTTTDSIVSHKFTFCHSCPPPPSLSSLSHVYLVLYNTF